MTSRPGLSVWLTTQTFLWGTPSPTRTVRCFPNNKPRITSELSGRKIGNYWRQYKNNLMSGIYQLETTRRCAGESWRTGFSRTTQQNMQSGMKKISSRWRIRYLDRENELNAFFIRLLSASSSPAPNQTDFLPSLDPQLPCHISSVSCSTSVVSCSTSVNHNRGWIRKRLQVQMC